MLYEVNLAQSELDALAALLGRPLDLVAADGWAAEMHSGEMVLGIAPVEVATPDVDHPYGEVERPLVQPAAESMLSGRLDVLAEAPGMTEKGAGL